MGVLFRFRNYHLKNSIHRRNSIHKSKDGCNLKVSNQPQYACTKYNLPAVNTYYPSCFRDHILYTVDWVDNNEVSVIWTSRVQNLGLLQICIAKTGSCQAVSIGLRGRLTSV
jgi:hypothetical protein